MAGREGEVLSRPSSEYDAAGQTYAHSNCDYCHWVRTRLVWPVVRHGREGAYRTLPLTVGLLTSDQFWGERDTVSGCLHNHCEFTNGEF